MNWPEEFGIHVNQINLWKKQLMESAPKVFSRGKDREAERLEREQDRLYRKVGQLQSSKTECGEAV